MIRISKDLSELPGWAELSGGQHLISVAARAVGYRRSEKAEIPLIKPGGDTILVIDNHDGTVDLTIPEGGGTLNGNTIVATALSEKEVNLDITGPATVDQNADGTYNIAL